MVCDRMTFEPVLTGLAVLCALRAHGPTTFAWRTERYEYVTDRLAIDLLLGDPELRLAIESGSAPRDVSSMMEPHCEDYRQRSLAYRLYA